jgi:hypothetical protein
MNSEDKPAQPEVFESHKPKQSDLSALLYSLQDSLRDTFMTCNSTPNGDYSIEIKLDSLEGAHDLHRNLIKLRII